MPELPQHRDRDALIHRIVLREQDAQPARGVRRRRLPTAVRRLDDPSTDATARCGVDADVRVPMHSARTSA